ncbi:MAG: membrane protein [Herpetosiphonaceae bacterium]|nr:MAG: membrane protein [Herpetosiphonaceae bacterium]
MIQALRRDASAYAALAAMTSKRLLAYNIWFWLELFVRTLSITVFVYFWRAVYANTNHISSLSLQQTLNYILFAQVLMPMAQFNLLTYFREIIVEGTIAIELLRPVRFQLANYFQSLAAMATLLFMNIPVALIAWLGFGLQLPASGMVWLCFAISLLLGQIALFFFDWALGCVAFYTHEVWGLGVLRYGIAAFFGGALIPLSFMPPLLQRVAEVLPFRLGMAMPLSVLTGVTPLSQTPRLWLIQLAWILGLGLLSQIVFRVAVRKITVFGG